MSASPSKGDMCARDVCFGPKADMMRLFSVQCVRGSHDAPGHSLGRDLKAFSGEPPAFQACLIVVCALVRPLGQFDLRLVHFFVRDETLPRKQTCAVQGPTSAKGQKRT